MNRREAIAALVSLPAISRISSAPMKPDDVIVIECDSKLSAASAARIVDTVKLVWPDRKVVILDNAMRLKVASR